MRTTLVSLALLGLIAGGTPSATATEPATPERTVVSVTTVPIRTWSDNVPMTGDRSRVITFSDGTSVARTISGSRSSVDVEALRQMVDRGERLPTVQDWERWGAFEDGATNPITGGPVGTGRLITDKIAARMLAAPDADAARRYKRQRVQRKECHHKNFGDVSLRTCAFQKRAEKGKWYRAGHRLHIPVRVHGFASSNPRNDSWISAVGGMYNPTIDKNAPAADFAPKNTIYKGSCSDVTFSAAHEGVGISIKRSVCPEKIQPWNDGRGASLRYNGSVWTSDEHIHDARATNYVVLTDWTPIKPKKLGWKLRMDANAKVRYHN